MSAVRTVPQVWEVLCGDREPPRARTALYPAGVSTHTSEPRLSVCACVWSTGLGLAHSMLHINMCERRVGETTHLTLEPNRRIYPLTDGWLDGEGRDSHTRHLA